MNPFRGRMPTCLTLVVGVGFGWILAGPRAPVLKAGRGDRSGDYSLATGPVAVEYNSLTKIQAQKDAIYFLDYPGGWLQATVPIQRSSMGVSQLVDGFIRRDLLADFKIDLNSGRAPHFLMTPGSLGAYGDGLSPLFIFETSTKQMAAYKLQTQAVGTKSTSRLELVEIKSFASEKAPTLKAGAIDRAEDYGLATGPVSVEYNSMTKIQAQKDAIYFLDYPAGRLLATIPIQRSTVGVSRLVDGFIERDILADFKIDPNSGRAPHFLMTPGTLGAYGEGWSPLFVFETSTKQMAAYKLQSQAVGAKSTSRLELIEINSYATLPPLPAAAN